MKKTNGSAAVTTLLFIGMLAGISLWNLLLPQQEFSSMENRSLTLFPPISAEGVQTGKWMGTFETYASDQFLFRDGFVRVKTAADLALRRKDNGRIFFGEDDYLFSMEPIHEKQLNSNLVLTADFMRRIREENSSLHTSVLLAPTALSVLADKLPAHAPVSDERAAFHRASAFLQAQVPGVVFTDPFGAFRAADAGATAALYYRTDHHWTTDGAYLAYCRWAADNRIRPYGREHFHRETVSDSFYGTNQSKAPGVSVGADSLVRYTAKWEPAYRVTAWKDVAGEAAGTEKNPGDAGFGAEVRDSLYVPGFLAGKDQYAYFLGGNDPQVRIETPVKNGRRLLLIKDSYANSMVPFLALHFEEIYITDLRYSHGNILWPENGISITDVMLLYSIQSFSADRNLAYLTQVSLP